MAKQAGYKARVLSGVYDLSQYLKTLGIDRVRNNIDVSVFSPGAANLDRVYISGIGSGTITLGGLFDPEDGASDEIIEALQDGTATIITVSIQGATAIGDRVVLLSGPQDGSPIDINRDDAVEIASNRQASGSMPGGIILHPHVSRSSAANFTGVDNGEATDFGSVAHLHVVSFTGTDATIKITDSVDEGVYADHITFTQVTDVTSERGSASGTVNDFARVELTGTFSEITFTVGFARLNQ